MAAVLLDGKKLAQTMQAEIAAKVTAMTERSGLRPGLAAVIVGDNPASQTYVRNKRKACQQVGFGPENLGLLTAGHPRYVPPTPHGVQQLLLRNNIPIEGRHVVIVGRSNIVGKPLALILMQKAAGANATVTVCHSRSQDLPVITRSADIVIVAIGQPRFLTADMIRPGAVVVDVGTNRLPDGKLVGDADFDAVREVASAISPVPGGVGPMTITMLLLNTLQAAELQIGH